MQSFLAPVHLVQDITSTLIRVWTLAGVLSEKGRNANGLIAVSLFDTLFGIIYQRYLRARE